MKYLEKDIKRLQTQLKDAYLSLKVQYIYYLTEKDILLECGKPQLDALYMVKIGQQQYRLMQQQLDLKQLKRQIDLAIVQLNHNQLIDWKKIADQLETEFLSEKERVFMDAKRIELAHIFFTNLLTVEKTVELRSLYRLLAKKLHPDINPDITQKQISLWYAVKEAYDHGNLDALKRLEIIVEDFSNDEIILSNDYLMFRIDLLQTGIKSLILEIQHLLQQFPFSIEKMLNDEMWVEEQCKEITKESEKIKLEQTKYSERLELLKSL